MRLARSDAHTWLGPVLIDTHCHLDMLEDVTGVLERMRSAGVERCVTIGVDRSSNETAVALADEHADVWATVGLHPHDARLRTAALMDRIAELASSPRVVGIGEAGLDYHYDNSPREQQRAVFAEHVRLAHALDKPLVIHSREAWDDTFKILEVEGIPRRFVFHCFTGGPVEAERALALGAVLSFSGVVTFPNAQPVREAARLAPPERIVVETDSPFLTPVPFRGRRNEPALVVHVADAVAAAKETERTELEPALARNARALFWPV